VVSKAKGISKHTHGKKLKFTQTSSGLDLREAKQALPTELCKLYKMAASMASAACPNRMRHHH
jgi:hypothetical protein